MARCEVIQVRCDRCRRVELRPPAPPKAKPDFEMEFLGRRIVYQDVDEYCREVLTRLADDIEEWNRVLHQRFGPTVPSNQAAPLQVAPSYSPPQPHSAAGGKR
jgi:hypothetical protein